MANQYTQLQAIIYDSVKDMEQRNNALVEIRRLEARDEEIKELRIAVDRLLTVMGEGGRRGRPMDLLSHNQHIWAIDFARDTLLRKQEA